MIGQIFWGLWRHEFEKEITLIFMPRLKKCKIYLKQHATPVRLVAVTTWRTSCFPVNFFISLGWGNQSPASFTIHTGLAHFSYSSCCPMKRCGLGSDSLFTPSLCDPLPGTLCFIYSAFDESYQYILSNFQLLKMVIVSNLCLTLNIPLLRLCGKWCPACTSSYSD